MTAVYPRWRGELTERRWEAYLTFGLSPLARGTLNDRKDAAKAMRFIPAGAGNSTKPESLHITAAVYPRWRGELQPGGTVNRCVSGLSPLARGTRLKTAQVKIVQRFIPAGAGNSVNTAAGAAGIAVYPRWRGELCKHNLLLINDFLSQSQSTNFIVSHKQHIHYVKEYLIH